MALVKYDEPVFRPPSEGQSLLLQVTIGCSNNKCTYCAMYRTKSYRVRDLSEIFHDIDLMAHQLGGHWPTGKIFLCDGDALGAPMSTLVPVVEYLKSKFPATRRLGIYATASNILEKTREELSYLAEMGLSIAYLGMESGCDKVLKMVVKGNTAEDMKNAGIKIKECGWKLSVIAMLGLGGLKHSASHVEQTAKVVSSISPNFFSFLTTMALPNTPYARMVDKGLCEPLTTKQLLGEMRDILSGINPSVPTIFRANHVSNQFPLAGTLPRDTEQLVSQIQDWWRLCPEGTYPEHRAGQY